MDSSSPDRALAGAQLGTPLVLALLGLGVAALFYAAWDGILNAVGSWRREEYSYGYFIPPLVAFFIWQRKNQLAVEPFTGSWAGLLLTAFGVFLLAFGELATLYTLVQYGFVVALLGLALALLGWRAFRWVAMPLALLFFTVPLPSFLYNNLSQELQLISSQIGVWVVMLFGIPVYLEGNVIELGQMKLQVADACSGLRYLFPLMAVGFIVAYLYRAPFWKRLVIFLSTIPITVLMNSLRIGLIGVTVDRWGVAAAEGFLHDFEGWVMFMASLGVLLFEMWLLSFVGRPRRSVLDSLQIDLPEPLPADTPRPPRTVPAPLWGTLVLLLATALAAAVIPHRPEVVPPREPFVAMPLQLDGWSGRASTLAPLLVDALRLDDYLVVDFTGPAGEQLELYTAYYASQRKGASVHSPRSCIPGGGWEIRSLEQRAIPLDDGSLLQVNRVLIQMGSQSQLVYYWFQQRGRRMTNEYLVKWYLFWDALTRRRTDGALVRLVTYVPNPQQLEAADDRLAGFAARIESRLGPHIPD